MAERGSTMRLNASCAAGHWAMTAIEQIFERAPSSSPTRSSRSTSTFPPSSSRAEPYHHPQTGLEGKYSVEYDMAAMALDGRGGLTQYTDAAVRRPEATGAHEAGPLGAARGRPDQGEAREHGRADPEGRDRADRLGAQKDLHGTMFDPLTEDEVRGKFHECASAVMPDEAQRNEVIDLCLRLRSLSSVRELTHVPGRSGSRDPATGRVSGGRDPHAGRLPCEGKSEIADREGQQTDP